MRVLDDRSRLFGLINPIDLVALIGILAAVGVVLVLLYGAPGEAEADTVPIEFDVLAVRLYAFDAESIVIGETLAEQTAGALGEVVSVTVEPASLDVLTDEGLVWKDSETMVNVRIRVRAEAVETEAGYAVRGLPIRENGMLNVSTRGFGAQKAYITDVEAVQ
jgi:hypothetical protein